MPPVPENGATKEYSESLISAIHASVFRSLYELQLRCLPILCVHSFKDFQRKEIWNELKNLKGDGFIGKLGVSVYTPNEAVVALQDKDVQHLQIPFNMLDWRWRAPNASSIIIFFFKLKKILEPL